MMKGQATRVVMVRANDIEHDSRGKKVALSLANAGYEVVFISAHKQGEDFSDPWYGPVRVRSVYLANSARTLRQTRAAVRRRRNLPLLDWSTKDEYITEVAVLRRRVNDYRDQRQIDPDHVGLKVGHTLARVALVSRRARWKAQADLDKALRKGWQVWDQERAKRTLGATDAGTLPELQDYDTTFSRVLDELQPDIIHVHHPLVLPVAARAAIRARANGRDCRLVYDARENFAGIPEKEQGTPRRHAVLLRQEERYISMVDAVLTVSDPIAAELHHRYHLKQRPGVVLNVPQQPMVTHRSAGTSIRERLGIDSVTPLLVYSGAVSRERGIEVLIDAMALLPEAHVALVTVPFPHPLQPEFLARAEQVGAADRLHVLPPVAQAEVMSFLSSADVAVHPMHGGSPNHDQALPNKLFEYLHAGVPMVVSDAKLMAAFVRKHGVGEVFASGDSHALAAAVRRVLANGTAHYKKPKVAAQFTWASQEETLIGTYARVLPPTVTAAPGRIPAPRQVDVSSHSDTSLVD